MTNRLNQLGGGPAWRLMVAAARRGAEEAGYKLERLPGRGLSNVYAARKNGETRTFSIRTTRDRYIAFPPLEGGTKWKTLDDVDSVLVATVDSAESPTAVEVYLFRADEVRKRFDASYAARVKNGLVMRDNFGMWLCLDPRDTRAANAVGTGIVRHYKPIATYSLDDLITAGVAAADSDEFAPAEEELAEMQAPASEKAPVEAPRPRTIAEVMAWARQQVADVAGVRVEAVKLDLKIEY